MELLRDFELAIQVSESPLWFDNHYRSLARLSLAEEIQTGRWFEIVLVCLAWLSQLRES